MKTTKGKNTKKNLITLFNEFYIINYIWGNNDREGYNNGREGYKTMTGRDI